MSLTEASPLNNRLLTPDTLPCLQNSKTNALSGTWQEVLNVCFHPRIDDLIRLRWRPYLKPRLTSQAGGQTVKELSCSYSSSKKDLVSTSVSFKCEQLVFDWMYTVPKPKPNLITASCQVSFCFLRDLEFGMCPALLNVPIDNSSVIFPVASSEPLPKAY